MSSESLTLESLTLNHKHTRQSSVDMEFPIFGLLPKKETGAYQFIQKYPNYDGRGITIGILDTGVDPGAAGLQITSDGRPKIIDIVDATGSGDVDCSTVVESIDGYITVLSGKRLKIPNHWNNPSNIYHIGVKFANELFPKLLRDRLSSEFKKEVWDPSYRQHLSDSTRNLEEFEKEHTSDNDLLPSDISMKENLQNCIDVLNSTDKKYQMAYTMFDCIVFHNGSTWCACLNTSLDDNLDEVKLMAPFYENHEYATIGQKDQMNYSFNVWENGNVLEIVTNAGSHGTHVASIAAAYFEDEPEKNGVAPGSQIVAIKIGDSRLGSMETGKSLVRAITHLNRRGVKLANYSYGEGYLWPNYGRIYDVIEEAVKEFGLIFVTSAGNQGPALSTVGAPAGICKSVIGVGAYVTPDMMQAEYSMREKLPPMHYTWSSRSPTLDGSLGISVSAPGGAITSVPNWTLKSSQLMNGTSMASPNACGCIALILSGLADKNIKIGSPHELKRALECCASDGQTRNFDTFAAGYGIIRVEKTFDHIVEIFSKTEKELFSNIDWKISVSTPKCTACHVNRGIIIREPQHAFKTNDYYIEVEPEMLGEGLEKEKINFSIHARLICDASYVNIPSHIELMNTVRSFYVQVKPTDLDSGAHYTEVQAYDSNFVERGPIWRIPITIIVPKRLPNWTFSLNNVSFIPGQIHRNFFVVPHGASYMEIEVLNTIADNNNKIETPHDHHFVVVAVREANYAGRARKAKRFTVAGGEKYMIPVPIRKDESTIEITIARWWASLGDAALSYTITFKGVKLFSDAFTLQAGNGALKVDLRNCSPRAEEITAQVTLRNAEYLYRPSFWKIHKLDSIRDCVVPLNRQIYGLDLTYKIYINRSSETTINFMALSGLLYESCFESQGWMLYDATTKAYLGAGDAFPNGYTKKLDKGDYLLRLQVRHPKQDVLEKLKDITLTVQMKLVNSINLDLHSDPSSALFGSRRFPSSITLPSGEFATFFCSSPPDDKLPSKSSTLNRLTGTLTLSKDDAVKKSVSFPFFYIVPPPVNGSNNKKIEKKKIESAEFEKNLLEVDRDAKISLLKKLAEPEKFYEELCIKYSDYVPLHVNYLQVLDNKSLTYTAEICKKALSLVDCNSVLINLGMKHDQRSDAKQIKTETENKKSWLIELNVKLANCLCDQIEEKRNDFDKGDSRTSAITEEIFNELSKVLSTLAMFCDVNHDQNVALVHARNAMLIGLYGKAMKILLKINDDRIVGQSWIAEDKIIDCCQKLGWMYLVDYFKKWKFVHNPVGPYRPF